MVTLGRVKCNQKPVFPAKARNTFFLVGSLFQCYKYFSSLMKHSVNSIISSSFKVKGLEKSNNMNYLRSECKERKPRLDKKIQVTFLVLSVHQEGEVEREREPSKIVLQCAKQINKFEMNIFWLLGANPIKRDLFFKNTK